MQNSPALTNATATGKSQIVKAAAWFFKRTHYWVTAITLLALAWNVLGLWAIDSYAPPYVNVSLGILLTLVFLPILGFHHGTYLAKDKFHKAWKWLFGTTFCLNILTWIAAGISFTSPYTHWKVTDSQGNVLQTTAYPSDSWSPDHNATDPITLDLLPSFGAFRWQKTVSVEATIKGQTCEVRYDIDLACPVTYNNVTELHEHPIDYSMIADSVRDYLPSIFAEAERNQANCGAGNFIEITSRFDPKSINPRINWSNARFVFSYRFKPIV